MKTIETIAHALTEGIEDIVKDSLEDCIIIRKDEWEDAYIDILPGEGVVFGAEDIDGECRHFTIPLNDFFRNVFDWADTVEERVELLTKVKLAVEAELASVEVETLEELLD